MTGMDRIVCSAIGHDWRPTSKMYSDGWDRECDRCGKEESVDR